MIKIEINQTLSNLFFIDLESINQMILLILLLLQSYFKDNWNTFDFVTVVGSIVDALMVEFAVSINIIIFLTCLIFQGTLRNLKIQNYTKQYDNLDKNPSLTVIFQKGAIIGVSQFSGVFCRRVVLMRRNPESSLKTLPSTKLWCSVHNVGFVAPCLPLMVKKNKVV